MDLELRQCFSLGPHLLYIMVNRQLFRQNVFSVGLTTWDIFRSTLSLTLIVVNVMDMSQWLMSFQAQLNPAQTVHIVPAR